MVFTLPAKTATVSVHIGQKLRQRRRALGLSQQQLAAQADISFQQLQKYEQGKNELNAQRLMAFASLLGVPVTYFFDGLAAADSGAATAEAPVPDTRETQALARHHRRIPDGHVRQGLTRLARSLAGERHDGEGGAASSGPKDL